jgi:hypothetical protein
VGGLLRRSEIEMEIVGWHGGGGRLDGTEKDNDDDGFNMQLRCFVPTASWSSSHRVAWDNQCSGFFTPSNGSVLRRVLMEGLFRANIR